MSSSTSSSSSVLSPTSITADSFSSLTPAITPNALELPHEEFRTLIRTRIRNAQLSSGFPIKKGVTNDDTYYDTCDIDSLNYTHKPEITLEEARALDQADIEAGRPLPTIPPPRHDMTPEIIADRIEFVRGDGLKPAPSDYPVRAQIFIRPSIGIGFIAMTDDEWYDREGYTEDQRKELAEQKKRPCTQEQLKELVEEERSALKSIEGWKHEIQQLHSIE